jgi:hypothetical protein
MRELTGRELDAVGGGFLNNKNFGTIQFNNIGGNGGAGGAGGATVSGTANGGNGGSGGGVLVGMQLGQQVNGIFSINGIVG